MTACACLTPVAAHKGGHENRHLEHQRRQGAPRGRRHLAQGDEPGRCLLPGDQVASTRPSRPRPSRSSATTSPCTGRRASTASPSCPSARSTRWPCAACRATRRTRTPATSRCWWPRAGGVVRVGNLYLPNGNPIGTDKFAYKLAWMKRLRKRARAICWSWRSRSCCSATTTSSPSRSTPRTPQAWTEDALFQPETRAAYRVAPQPRPHGRRARLPSRPRRLHVLGLPGRRLAEGPRHPHRPHPGCRRRQPTACVAAGIDKFTRGWEKPSDHVPVWIELDATELERSALSEARRHCVLFRRACRRCGRRRRRGNQAAARCPA